jgi:hypothetical protein
MEKRHSSTHRCRGSGSGPAVDTKSCADRKEAAAELLLREGVRVDKFAWDDARAPSTDRMTDIPVPPKKPERPPLHGERNGINVLRLRISRRPT